MEKVIADMKNLIIWDFILKNGNETEMLNRANASIKTDIELYDKYRKNPAYDTKYWENRYNYEIGREYVVTTYEEFKKAERDHYLNRPIIEVTEEVFNDQLNVLPPLKWCTKKGVEMFCMCEMITGTYTDQYAKVGDKYYSKTVDVLDETTWIHNHL